MKRKGLGPSLMLKLVILIIAVGLVISGLVLAGVKEGSSFFPGPFGNLNFYLTGKIQPYNDEDSNRVFKGIWPFTNLYCDLKSEGAGFSDEVKQQCFGTHDFESCLTGACYPQDDSSIRISRIDQKNGKVIWGNAEGGVDVKVPRGVSDGERVGIACNQESCYVAQHYRDEVTFLYKIDKENRIITDLGDFGTSPGGGSFYVVANPYMKCDDSDALRSRRYLPAR